MAQCTGLPTVVCTMYQPHYSEPVQQRAAATALAIFNDRLIRLAVDSGLSIVDYRSVCTDPADFGEQGLLSIVGLGKVAEVIWRALHESAARGPGTEIFR